MMTRRVACVVWLVSGAAACSGSPGSLAPSQVAPPAAPQAVLSILPGPDAPLGAAGYTPFVFDGSASTGDGLSYRIEFGDGATADTAVASHVIGQDGAATARLTVTDRLGRTHSVEQELLAAAVETRYHTFWHARLDGGRGMTIYLTRNGAELSGLLQMQADDLRNVQLTGRLTGDRDVILHTEDGSIQMSGRLEWRQPGDVNFSQVRVGLRLSIAGGPADGESVLMTWSDPY